MSDEQQIEQQQATDTQAPETGGATRDELLEAVRAAGGTASVDVDAETAAAAAKAGEAPQAPPPVDPDERLNAILRAREEQHKKRLDADSYALSVRQAAEQEKARLIEEARAEARRIADQELSELRAKFSGSPTAALRALSSDPQEVIDAVVREGSAEARALAKLQEEARQAREDAQVGKRAAEELAKYKEEKARDEEAQRVSGIRTEFLRDFASPEKAPYLHARFDPEEVFDRCNQLCKEWQADGLKLGEHFDRADLVGYLEKQSRERFKSLPGSPPAQQVSAGAPSKEPGNAPKVPANGSRTLSAAAGSERRTTPRPLSEMNPAEARAALIEEVAAARRANPDANL